MAQLKSKQLTYPLSGSFTGSLYGTSSWAITASYAMNGGGNPGGLNTQIQYNSSSVFEGVPVLTYDGITLIGTGSFSGSFTGLIDSASYAATASYAPDYLLLTETGSITVLSSSYAATASIASTASYYQETDPIFVEKSGSLATTGSNSFNGNQTITGSLTVTEPIYIGTIDGTDAGGITLQVSDTNITVAEEQIDIKVSDGNTINIIPTLISTNIPISASFSGSLYGTASWSEYSVTASYYQETDPIFVAKSGSLATTGSNIFIGNQTITGSINLTGSLNQIGDYTHTGNVNHSGSKFLNGIFVQTGSLSITGSTTQIGNNTLAGNTTLSGSIIISGSTTVPATPTIKIYGDMETDGVIKFMPVSKNIDTSISASYIYVSGSTNDLYFSQNSNGFNNVTRLRWVEGSLYTGLLHGGLITTQSNTVYQIQSGSGIIVDLNASQDFDPYPTIQYLNWGTLSASIAPLSASFDQSFVSINSDTQIFAQGTPYENGQYNTLIPIGNVIHQNRSSINATATYPSLAYGWKQRSSDFIRAFGPLKLSGLDVAVSGSSTGSLIITSGTSFNDGRNYTLDADNPSYVQDSGTTVSKIFRYYQSGSNGWGYQTNGGAGFETINPTQYSNNGVLTTLTGTGANREWTIQRVYWFTGGATKGIYVYYGNSFYVSKADAIANINIEPFIEAPNTRAGAVLAGYLILRNNANFTVPESYQIIPSGLFRNVGGSGGGGSVVTQTLSGLSDVAITGPINGQPLVYNTSALKWENSNTLTASLHGNADTATTASYALTASYAPDYVLNAVTASMLAPYVLTSVTSSMTVLSSSFAATASLAPNYLLLSDTASMLQPYVLTSVTSSMTVLNAQTASFITASNVYGPYGLNSILSSSYALTASYALTSAGGGSGAGFPFTGSAVITGSLIVTGSATFTDSIIIDATLVTSSIVITGAGTTVISTQATGSYRSMFAKYVVSNGANSRAGEFMSVWNEANIRFTDTSTTDIGSTAAVVLTGSLSGENVQVSTAPGIEWTVKLQTTYL
jgi:hypothetical protein